MIPFFIKSNSNSGCLYAKCTRSFAVLQSKKSCKFLIFHVRLLFTCLSVRNCFHRLEKKLLTLRPHTFLFFYGKQQLLRSQEVIIIFTEKSFDIESTGYLEISSTGWSKITFCETFLMNLTRSSFKLAFLYLSINVHGCENFEPLFELVICSFSSSDKDCKNSPGTGHKLLTVNHITIWIDQHTRHQKQKTQFK